MANLSPLSLIKPSSYLLPKQVTTVSYILRSTFDISPGPKLASQMVCLSVTLNMFSQFAYYTFHC